MKFSKVEVGEEYYFDILGKTDKNETYTVTIIEKRPFPKKRIIVKSNQTNDVFNCDSKYLVPIHSSDISNYNCIIRSDNNIINIDEVDYEILKTIKNLLVDYENIDKIEEGLNLLLSKMSMIVKNNNSCDILKNLEHKNFNIQTNLLKNIMNDSDKYNSSEKKYIISESIDKKFKAFTNELIKHLNSNDESFDVYEYFHENFPDEILFLKNLTNNKKITEKIDYEDIKNIADQIYSLLSDSNTNKIVFVPYCFFGKKSVLVFDQTSIQYGIDYILDNFNNILKESDYIVNYAIQIICLEKRNNNDGEENDYE